MSSRPKIRGSKNFEHSPPPLSSSPPVAAVVGRYAGQVAARCRPLRAGGRALRRLPCRAALCPARCRAGRALRLPPVIMPPADVAARPPMPSARAAAPHGIGKGTDVAPRALPRPSRRRRPPVIMRPGSPAASHV